MSRARAADERRETMPRQCAICGKRTEVGYKYARRGLAKHKGGVGRKVTGRTKRKFRPNLQKVRASVGGSLKRMLVCTRCIKSDKIKKPVKKSPFDLVLGGVANP